jgi:hypothetical protein
MANITESPAFKAAEPAEADNNELSAPTEEKVAEEAPVQNILAEETGTQSAPVEEVAAVETQTEATAEVESSTVVEAETSASVSATPSTPSMNEAGQSPETLAFVRSVLEKKDAEKSAAASAPAETSAPESVEPAAGIEGNYSGAKTHYVQLASISERGRADAEWEKLKKDMAAIPGSSAYRVQEANLDSGTFFRIQAGPYSEAQAKDICDALKAQKPGGCLVVR